MIKDKVDMYIRVIHDNKPINTWSLYRKLDGSYAVDVDNEDGTSGIYELVNIELKSTPVSDWEKMDGHNVQYVKRNLRYANTGQLVYPA